MLRQVLEKLDGKTILFFPNFNPNIKTIVHVHPETSLNQTHIFETVHKEYWWMCLSCNRYVQCLSWTNSIHKKCIKYLKRNNGGKNRSISGDVEVHVTLTTRSADWVVEIFKVRCCFMVPWHWSCFVCCNDNFLTRSLKQTMMVV